MQAEQSIVVDPKSPGGINSPHGLILFDGVCVLCSRGCRFVSERDRRNYFRFVPIQVAEGRPLSELAGPHSSRPLISGEPDMDLEEAAARMVQHRIRRLPVVGAEGLVGIVTLDDIAVRTGDLEVAQRMTKDVIEGAFPEFFFHERG